MKIKVKNEKLIKGYNTKENSTQFKNGDTINVILENIEDNNYIFGVYNDDNIYYYIFPKESFSFVDEKYNIMVLNDGETFSGLDGCKILTIPSDFTTEDIETMLNEYIPEEFIVKEF